MFPEYRKLITSLKGKEAHFDKLFNEHNQLDKDIVQLENEEGNDDKIKELKQAKLQLKDELRDYLKRKQEQ
ncbi:DUF465 domain-containing protein [Photobacterium damselae subsp. piscicida]|uniref:YdcH family protein n=1 Tax=Photobacterium damselae TaxID=38293 RepID=UPI0010767B22|nr:DUF465 domain-containing protein [Photobacterium damselae]TFZ62432.1 DUF465 domain-containing protein [Photobacterium damselae subsp. piscicida]